MSEQASTSANEGRISGHRPTLSQRFWRATGFRYHLGEEPAGSEDLPFVRTDIGIHFDLFDRIRLLLSGRIFICSTVYMPPPLPEKPLSRMDFLIQPPGEKEWR